MKILYLINHAGKAGTEKYVLNLVERYNEREAKCYFAYNEPGLLSEQMAERKISTFQFEMKNPYDIKAAKVLSRICRENKIDIIHAQYPRECYIAVLSKLFYKKTKIVFTSHLTLSNSIAWKITNRLITPFVDRVISVCNSGKELLINNGYPKKKIDVIYNGVIPSGGKREKSTIREELGISEDTFVITTLARLHYSKGLEFLIDSIEKLDRIIKRNYVLLIGGDGELYDELKNRIEDKGLSEKIKLLGFRKDAYNILCGSDIYVNSSMCLEALSFAILEALNASLPTVATNVGGNGDIINENTGCGRIVEYGDTDAMANAIYELSENSEYFEKCRENCIKTINEVFNLEKIFEDTFDVYKKVMGK